MNICELEKHWTNGRDIATVCETIATDLENNNSAAIDEAIEVLRVMAHRERKNRENLRLADLCIEYGKFCRSCALSGETPDSYEDWLEHVNDPRLKPEACPWRYCYRCDGSGVGGGSIRDSRRID